MLLLNQFHDILPGSSIGWVYRQAEREFAGVAAALDAMIARSLRLLAGDGTMPMVANAGPYPADGVAGLSIGEPTTAVPGTATRDGDHLVLESDLVRARLDTSGRLVSFVDLGSGREFIPPGAVGNDLQLFRDTPNRFDAWDIDESYRRNRIDLTGTTTIGVAGDTAVVDRTVGDSPVRQVISLATDRPALLIRTRVDWRENQKLLKLAFGVDVHTDHAASEIAFGHLVRPTHENTSWDAARFETSAHRWMRLAEPGGVWPWPTTGFTGTTSAGFRGPAAVRSRYCASPCCARHAFRTPRRTTGSTNSSAPCGSRRRCWTPSGRATG